jgi:phosphonate transport system substrate-binding protein
VPDDPGSSVAAQRFAPRIRAAACGRFLALALCVLVAACSQPEPAGSAGELAGRLRVGVLPDEAPDRLQHKYAYLTEALRSRTGFDVELVIPDSYGTLSRMFSEGRVDVAYFGGYTFVRARERDGAVPLVMRDIDARFVSYVLVPADSDAADLADLAGSRFSFGARLSTSGHIMPRHFFAATGIEPEAFFAKVSYSGAHDRTIEQIAAGAVDAGVVNAQIARQWMARRADDVPAVRVLWQSPHYVDYVWAAQPSMTHNTRNAVKEVFLTLSRANPEQARFLDAVGAAYFLPAHVTDFDQLTAAVRAVERQSATSG